MTAVFQFDHSYQLCRRWKSVTFEGTCLGLSNQSRKKAVENMIAKIFQKWENWENSGAFPELQFAAKPPPKYKISRIQESQLGFYIWGSILVGKLYFPLTKSGCVSDSPFCPNYRTATKTCRWGGPWLKNGCWMDGWTPCWGTSVKAD